MFVCLHWNLYSTSGYLRCLAHELQDGFTVAVYDIARDPMQNVALNHRGKILCILALIGCVALVVWVGHHIFSGR